MNIAISKTLSLILLIAVGYFLKSRIISVDQKKGLKEIILCVALPAMIFIALQRIVFEVEMIIIPVLALAFNFSLFFLTDFMVVLFRIKKDTALYRTFKMLLPSLAPGLSCFPFLLEYMGEKTLADAALADIGNKLFVLVILYLFSMRWYYRYHQIEAGSNGSKVLSLLNAMVKEPVNFVILIAIVMLGFGINYTTFPSFVQMSVDRLAIIMTPLILIFIGVSVKFKWSQVKMIFLVLMCRSAIAFLMSGLLIVGLNLTDPAMILLAILFPQSSCSFWPVAHMSAVSSLEGKIEDHKKEGTFDLDFAMNVLALSLPFSTVLILCICTFSESVASNTYFSFLTGLVFFVIAILPVYLRYLRKGIILKTVRAESTE